MADQSNLDQLRAQAAEIQAQIAEQEARARAVPADDVAFDAGPQPFTLGGAAPVPEAVTTPVDGSDTNNGGEGQEAPTVTTVTPSNTTAGAPVDASGDQATIQALLQRLAALEQRQNMATAPGPGATFTEPGSPYEAAHQSAMDAGAVGHLNVTTKDGAVGRAYLYSDGTVRLP